MASVSQEIFNELVRGTITVADYIGFAKDGAIVAPWGENVFKRLQDADILSKKERVRLDNFFNLERTRRATTPEKKKERQTITLDPEVLSFAKQKITAAETRIEEATVEVGDLTAEELLESLTQGRPEAFALAKTEEALTPTPVEEVVAAPVEAPVDPDVAEAFGPDVPDPVTAFDIDHPTLGKITVFLDQTGQFISAMTATGGEMAETELRKLKQEIEQRGEQFEMKKSDQRIQNLINVGDFFGRQEERALRREEFGLKEQQAETMRLANLAARDEARAALIAQAGPLGRAVAEAFGAEARGAAPVISTRGLDIDAETLELFGITGTEFAIGDEVTRAVGTPLGEPQAQEFGITETIPGVQLQEQDLTTQLLAGISERGGELDLAALASIIGLDPSNLAATAARTGRERAAPRGSRVFATAGRQ